MRKSGLVVTNNHVILNAEKIKVVLVDGRNFEAKVIARDPHTDLAALSLIKTDENRDFFVKEGFPVMQMGRGDSVEVGDVVLAIGNNLGLQGTVTQGIISCVGRIMPRGQGGNEGEDGSQGGNSLPISTAKIAVPLIQTSASINPGSSGGALVNMSGELVGINTMIMTPSGGNVGLAFAVPANYITPLLQAVDESCDSVRRPFIGCTLSPTSFGLHGVNIHGVMKGGPADKGGIKSGDIVYKLGDVQVDDSDRFLMMIALQPIGSTVRLAIRRRKDKTKKVSAADVETLSCTVVVGEWKPEQPKTLQVTDKASPLHGVTFAEMSAAVNNAIGIQDHALTGVVVLKVDQSSPTYGFFRVGDVIQKIATTKIDSLDNLEKAMNQVLFGAKGGKSFKIRVARRSVVIEFTLRVPDKNSTISNARSKL